MVAAKIKPQTVQRKPRRPGRRVAVGGAQDVGCISYLLHGQSFVIPITTGKKLRLYQYRLESRDTRLETAAGNYKTLHFVNAVEGGDEKKLWLGVEANYLPVRIVLPDDKGGAFDQVLTSLRMN